MHNNKSVLYAAALVLVMFWGTAYTLVGYSIDYISPAWMVAVRTGIAAILLCIYTLMRGHRFPPIRDVGWLWYGLMSFIGLTIPFYLNAVGQEVVESGLTSILAGVMPLITIVLAHFFIKGEHLSWRKGFGFVIGFTGIVLLFLPAPFKLDIVSTWRSQVLILLTALFYASNTIIAKRAPDIAASLGSAIMLSSAAIVSFIWALSTGIPETMPPGSAIFAVVLLAIGGTAIAQILYLRIVKIQGPSFIAKMVYLVPVFSIIAGMVFLDEPFSARAILAMLIIFFGLFIARSGKTAK